VTALLLMFAVTVLQNASFTLVSRARNSGSVGFHAAAAVASNGVWLLVIRQVVQNLDSVSMMLAYLVGSVTGSVLMHVVSMRWIEKGKRRVGG
jgi:putative flippase GtrA